MASATFLAILFVPLFFVLVAGRGQPPERREPVSPGAAGADANGSEKARIAAIARESAHA
jgi:hypothetical protein